MTSEATMPGKGTSLTDQNFSIVLGGPLYQFLLRTRMSDDALTMVRRRIVFISLFAWLPLLVLAAVEGQLLGGSIAIPFLLDVEVHARFLVALPLLIAAELVVHQRMRPIVQTFLERNLIPESGMPRFAAAIDSALRLRNSVLAEVLLLAFVYGIGIVFVWRQFLALDAATWYATPTPGGSTLSPAGIWYGYVSVPVFQFLVLRWYFRLFVWARFLWQVSRIKLSLIPIHPDRLGGLGFLSNTVYAFAVLAAAHGALLAGTLANRILFLGASLPDFKMVIGSVVLFLLCVVLGPLLVFSPQLAQAKRTGLREYGTLAERYVREFDAKWLRRDALGREPLVGSADIQSLADLDGSYEVLRSMRMVPVNRDAIVQLATAMLLPIVPLALTMMPLEDLVKQLFGILF